MIEFFNERRHVASLELTELGPFKGTAMFEGSVVARYDKETKVLVVDCKWRRNGWMYDMIEERDNAEIDQYRRILLTVSTREEATRLTIIHTDDWYNYIEHAVIWAHREFLKAAAKEVQAPV